MKTFKENFLPAAAAAVQPLLMGCCSGLPNFGINIVFNRYTVFGEGKLSNYKIVTTKVKAKIRKIITIVICKTFTDDSMIDWRFY